VVLNFFVKFGGSKPPQIGTEKRPSYTRNLLGAAFSIPFSFVPIFLRKAIEIEICLKLIYGNRLSGNLQNSRKTIRGG
jgi:hypothetical protein